MKLAKAVGYTSAGTVEFIVDSKRNFYFLEMNTRLQVEHPVTELITGLDLVEQMIRIAAGEKLSFAQSDVKLNGWAVESRLYAEDPYRNFLPSIGRLTKYRPPTEGLRADKTILRNDTGVYEGGEISMFYDPMIAKLCIWGPDRLAAINAMQEALDQFEVEGIAHNLPFLSAVMGHERFRSGNITTAFIADEFPDGFNGVVASYEALKDLARIAAYIHWRCEERSNGNYSKMLRRSMSEQWVVRVGGQIFSAKVVQDISGHHISLDGETPLPISSSWKTRQSLGHFYFGERELYIKISLTVKGIRLRHHGMDMVAQVQAPHVAALAKFMVVKQPKDTSRFLLCPMPGLLRSLAVSIGDAVEPGQSVAVVEAMKMENVLRSERKAIVKNIAAQVGDSLSVDQLIMEFE